MERTTKRNANGVKISRTGRVQNIPCKLSEWWRNTMDRRAYLTDFDGVCYGYKDGRPFPKALMEIKEADWYMFGCSAVEAITSTAELLKLPCLLVRIIDDETIEVAVTRRFLNKREIEAYCKANAKRMSYETFKTVIEKEIYNL